MHHPGGWGVGTQLSALRIERLLLQIDVAVRREHNVLQLQQVHYPHLQNLHRMSCGALHVACCIVCCKLYCMLHVARCILRCTLYANDRSTIRHLARTPNDYLSAAVPPLAAVAPSAAAVDHSAQILCYVDVSRAPVGVRAHERTGVR